MSVSVLMGGEFYGLRALYEYFFGVCRSSRYTPSDSRSLLRLRLQECYIWRRYTFTY